MDPNPVDQAWRLVRDRFPAARGAILGGSTATGRATATSDLDIAVLIRDGGESQRETIRFEGRVVELFLHTRADLVDIFAADVAARRATMQSIYVTGLVLIDTDGEIERARATAEEHLRKGPPALPTETVESKRYGLTDALDDLADTDAPAERLAVAGVVLRIAAELLCDHHHTWNGNGKWLPRRVIEADAERGAALLESHLHLCRSEDPLPMIDAASEILDLAGGPLREGFRRTWHGVGESVPAGTES